MGQRSQNQPTLANGCTRISLASEWTAVLKYLCGTGSNSFVPARNQFHSVLVLVMWIVDHGNIWRLRCDDLKSSGIGRYWHAGQDIVRSECLDIGNPCKHGTWTQQPKLGPINEKLLLILTYRWLWWLDTKTPGSVRFLMFLFYRQ